MKDLRVYIKYGKIDFEGTYIDSFAKEGSYILDVSIANILEIESIPHEINVLSVSIKFCNRLYTQFDCEVTSVKRTDIGYLFILKNRLPTYSYDQQVIEIFRIWQNGDDIPFLEQPIPIKKAYLTACLSYSGVPQSIMNSIAIVDCQYIHDKYDLFLMLGKSLIGSRGYFGQDFDGVKDCLFSCGTTNVEIQFVNSYNLKSVLSKEGDDLYELFLGDFRALGYSVKLY